MNFPAIRLIPRSSVKIFAIMVLGIARSSSSSRTVEDLPRITVHCVSLTESSFVNFSNHTNCLRTGIFGKTWCTFFARLAPSLCNATLGEFDVHKTVCYCRLNSFKLLLIGKDIPKGPPSPLSALYLLFTIRYSRAKLYTCTYKFRNPSKPQFAVKSHRKNFSI